MSWVSSMVVGAGGRTHKRCSSPAHMPPARLLEGLTSADAARRIPGTPHTIVGLVAHLVFWQNWF